MTTPTIRVRTPLQPQPRPTPDTGVSSAAPPTPQWLDEPPGAPIVVPTPSSADPNLARQKRKRPKKVERVLGNYEVGFCKPPKATKWEKGFCPNTRGRPKKSKSVDAHLEDALNERITVQEGGRRRKMTKGEAIAKRLVNDAMTGNAKARDQVFRRTAVKTGTGGTNGSVLNEALHDEIDWQILNDFAREIGGRLPDSFGEVGVGDSEDAGEAGDA